MRARVSVVFAFVSLIALIWMSLFLMVLLGFAAWMEFDIHDDVNLVLPDMAGSTAGVMMSPTRIVPSGSSA